MTRNSHTLHLLGAALVAMALAGCASSSGRAPVVDIGVAPGSGSARSEKPTVVAEVVGRRAAASGAQDIYVVQKGDTLYSIAFSYGVDYHELAEDNNIDDPSAIQVGQQLRVPGAGGTAVARPAPAAVIARPMIVDQPKVAKLPYSEQAVAQIEKMQQQQAAVVAKAEPAPAPQPVKFKEEPVSNGSVAWGMPANGKVIASFSESANRKGIDIAGKLGQPVFASAGGKVVYSGSGLRGYGKLVIVKHNTTYLSAYAHNSRILVKEGQTVARGQKIAEMGNTDSDRIALHFEIRKLGKPVDPAQYLNLPKS
ncbi:MAG: peptidoglycan DD-metalloendopeptidase family protein [Sideroxydans sp.]|nr:peptidoglycan DD-metalloendopeptidase family protein [Sideroxydans sp.]